MTEIDFSDVTLTPAVIARGQRLCEESTAQCRAAGIQLTPICETLHDLGNGQLRMVARVAPEVTFVLTAERGEWHRVTEN